MYDPIDEHLRRRPYHHNDKWTYEQQWNWLDAKQLNDPHWADTEFTIRREAVRIQQQLRDGRTSQLVETTVLRPSAEGILGTESVRVSFMFTRVGGIEELLLIEENLRRAMGLV